MGGQAGGRGYLLQTLIAVLDIVRDDRDWLSVALEPDVESEKVDILWTCPDGGIAIQVKSSQNQIGLADVQRWAAELESSYHAQTHELRLIGPCSASVIQLKQFGKVRIPTPLSLNVAALIEQCAHKLDHYLEAKGITRVPPFARELIVNALAARFAVYATNGQAVSRAELDRLLGDWLLEIYPQCLSQAVEMQCSLLWSTISIPLPTTNGTRIQLFIAPMTFLNGGVQTTIVQDLFVEVSLGDRRIVYQAMATVDLTEMQEKGRRMDFSQMTGLFTEFAIAPNQIQRLDFVFVTGEMAEDQLVAWQPGTLSFRAFAFLADRDHPTVLRERTLVLKHDFSPALNGENACIMMQFERPKFRI